MYQYQSSTYFDSHNVTSWSVLHLVDLTTRPTTNLTHTFKITDFSFVILPTNSENVALFECFLKSLIHFLTKNLIFTKNNLIKLK